jgi:hypothetical protein
MVQEAMNFIRDTLMDCEDRLTILDETDALGVLCLMISRAINRLPAEQRGETAACLADSIIRNAGEVMQ